MISPIERFWIAADRFCSSLACVLTNLATWVETKLSSKRFAPPATSMTMLFARLVASDNGDSERSVRSARLATNEEAGVNSLLEYEYCGSVDPWVAPFTRGTYSLFNTARSPSWNVAVPLSVSSKDAVQSEISVRIRCKSSMYDQLQQLNLGFRASIGRDYRRRSKYRRRQAWQRIVEYELDVAGCISCWPHTPCANFLSFLYARRYQIGKWNARELASDRI